MIHRQQTVFTAWFEFEDQDKAMAWRDWCSPVFTSRCSQTGNSLFILGILGVIKIPYQGDE